MNFFKKILFQRAARHGTNSAILVGMILFGLTLVNLLAIQYNMRVDLTKIKRFTLAPHTLKVLESIKQPVKITALFEKGYPDREGIEDLLHSYGMHSESLSVQVVDPDKNPRVARKYDIDVYGVTVLESRGKIIKVQGVSEEALTNALIKVTQEHGKVVYFLKGHGEGSLKGLTKADFLSATNALEYEGYTVKSLTLHAVGQVPADCVALVIAGPKKALLKREIEIITNYLERGKSALFLIDPGHSEGLAPFFDKWGIDFGNNIIVDPLSKLFGGDMTMPVVTDYQQRHEITAGFKYPSLYSAASTVSAKKDIGKGLKVVELAFTNPNSGAESDIESGDFTYNPGKDLKGALSVAVAVSFEKAEQGQDERGARIVVVGDSDFATSAYVKFSGNRDFLVNIVNWLTRQEKLISIRPKTLNMGALNLTQKAGNIYFYFTMVLFPVIIILIGTVVWLRRRTL
jgi:ABC-type uncharacterized transport system involved in gliding motility auxiliary subunit